MTASVYYATAYLVLTDGSGLWHDFLCEHAYHSREVAVSYLRELLEAKEPKVVGLVAIHLPSPSGQVFDTAFEKSFFSPSLLERLAHPNDVAYGPNGFYLRRA